MIVKLLSNSSCEIALLSGKERKPFPDNKCMKLNHYENQLDFRFLTDTASLKSEGEKYELCSQIARKNERAGNG